MPDDDETKENDYEDPVADALVGGSPYERLRIRRVGSFKQPIRTKLRWQSGLLFALALTLPLFAVMPAGITGLLPTGDPLSGSPKIIVLGLIGGAVTFVTGLALVGIALARVRLAGAMTEDQARTLLSLEELASLFGFVTGGLAITITFGVVLLAVASGAALEAYVEVVGRNPFGGTGTVPVSAVATFAFAGSVVLFTASQLAETLGDGRE